MNKFSKLLPIFVLFLLVCQPLFAAFTQKEAGEFFARVKNLPHISLRVAEDGCYLRARAGVSISKSGEAQLIETIGEFSIYTPWAAGGRAEWQRHAAIAVWVILDKGEMIQMVIDPALFDEPVTIETWLRKLASLGFIRTGKYRVDSDDKARALGVYPYYNLKSYSWKDKLEWKKLFESSYDKLEGCFSTESSERALIYEEINTRFLGATKQQIDMLFTRLLQFENRRCSPDGNHELRAPLGEGLTGDILVAFDDAHRESGSAISAVSSLAQSKDPRVKLIGLIWLEILKTKKIERIDLFKMALPALIDQTEKHYALPYLALLKRLAPSLSDDDLMEALGDLTALYFKDPQSLIFKRALLTLLETASFEQVQTQFYKMHAREPVASRLFFIRYAEEFGLTGVAVVPFLEDMLENNKNVGDAAQSLSLIAHYTPRSEMLLLGQIKSGLKKVEALNALHALSFGGEVTGPDQEALWKKTLKVIEGDLSLQTEAARLTLERVRPKS